MKYISTRIMVGSAIALLLAVANSTALASMKQSSISVTISSQDDSGVAATYAWSLETEIRRQLLEKGALVVDSDGPAPARQLIRGGVYLSGENRLTFKTEYLNSETGELIWAESYSRDVGPAVHDVATDVVEKVLASMTYLGSERLD